MVGGSIPLSELGGHSFQPDSNRGWGWFEHKLKHDLKGPSYAMRSIQNMESSRDDKKRALSCVALKKKGPKRRASSLRFIPPAPALEGKIRKAGKDRWRGSSILFSSLELPDRRSIRNGLRVHFVGRNDPIHSGLRGTPQKTNLTSFIDRING
jgi:hypothetical protein